MSIDDIGDFEHIGPPHRLRAQAIDRAVAAERERCAQVAENPGFIECRDTEWDEGVNYAKRFIAAAIRRT